MTKLLEISMVANKWSGSSRSFNIFCWRGSLSSISSRSADVMEKKATSDPEISADKSNNKARTKSNKISADARCPKLWARSKNNEGGSVSKGSDLVQLRTVGHLRPVTGMQLPVPLVARSMVPFCHNSVGYIRSLVPMKCLRFLHERSA